MLISLLNLLLFLNAVSLRRDKSISLSKGIGLYGGFHIELLLKIIATYFFPLLINYVINLCKDFINNHFSGFTYSSILFIFSVLDYTYTSIFSKFTIFIHSVFTHKYKFIFILAFLLYYILILFYVFTCGTFFMQSLAILSLLDLFILLYIIFFLGFNNYFIRYSRYY